jgi:alcohol dehydrogenase class IV
MKRFYLPTEIVTGPGCFEELGKVAQPSGKRALLVCGASSLRASGRLDRARELLRDAGLTTTLCDAVAGEPTLDLIQAGLDLARAEEIEVVVGIGGGSAMDTAKAIAGLYSHPGTIYEYHKGERTLHGGGLPWIAVPTTAGTGAEVTKNAVLLDPANLKKASLRHDGWYAHVALIDPELTLGAPPEVTAASGSDALTQAIESYTSIGASALTDGLAFEAIARIARSLERAVHGASDGAEEDLEARADMLYGSTLAGCAMANARLGGIHGIAHPLGALYHIPHGLVCGLLLPYVMAYNLEYAQGKYARLAPLLGVETRGLDDRSAAEGAVQAIGTLISKVGIPRHLAPLGLKRKDYATIVRGSLPSGSFKHNPRPLGAKDVEAILDAAW